MKLFLKFVIVLLVFNFISCTKHEVSKQVKDVMQDSIPKNNKKMVNSIAEVLLPKAKKTVSKWNDYKELDVLMTRYYAVSKNDAYNNAEELVALTSHLKDSIVIKKLETPAMKIRFNVLHNEALRLQDMASLSDISKEALNAQLKRIIAAYGVMNAKINDLISVDDLEQKMKDFDSALLNANFAEIEKQSKQQKTQKQPSYGISKKTKKINKKKKIRQQRFQKPGIKQEIKK